MTTDLTAFIRAGALPLIAPDLLAQVVAMAGDVSVFVSKDDIVQAVMANPHHRSFGSIDHWQGAKVTDLFTRESAAKLAARVAELRAAPVPVRALELNHADPEDRTMWAFPVQYSLHRMDGEGAFLMVGRDLRPLAEAQQDLVRMQIALEREHQEQRDLEAKLRAMIAASRDGIMVFALGSGRILDANAIAEDVFGAAPGGLAGRLLEAELDAAGRAELAGWIAAGADTATLHLVLARTGRPIAAVPTLYRAGGEWHALLRFDGRRERQAEADPLAADLAGLYRRGPDAVVFTDAAGTIRVANDAFLRMTALPSVLSARGRPMADFLARGAADMRALSGAARLGGAVRLYPTRLRTAFGDETEAEVSATWLATGQGEGLGLVIRDAGGPDPGRVRALPPREGQGRGAANLVGTAPLRDIVAETTDVIEKMCIEAALAQSRNNRVAAAEILGLSRQSLYVKLRKYGLIGRDEI
ncbi:MAG: transcriptional regulator PpsR [Rhodobacteraceae bacterium]|nr:transcriptional regulator PpsR [Paracoccaceae bacterium]